MDPLLFNSPSVKLYCRERERERGRNLLNNGLRLQVDITVSILTESIMI